MTPDVRRARIAFLWVGVIVPLGIIALTAIVVASWLPEIPDPSAVHWGTDGVDGFGPSWIHLVVLLGVGGGTVSLLAVMALFAHRVPQHGRPSDGGGRTPQWSPAARFLGAVNLSVAVMVSGLALVSVGVQRGLTDAADSPDITPWVFLGFGLLVVLTIVGWFLQPATEAPPAEAEGSAAALPLASGERAVWVGTATMARAGQIVLGLALFVMIAASVLMIAQGVSTWWITAALTIVMAVLVLSSFTFRVRVTPAGLSVRSLAGWPRIDIAARDVESVRAVDVNPFGEFGGWGYRIGLDGRSGVVLRTGEGLEVARTGGRVFVVTIDDAATAASVLAAAARTAR